MPTEALVSHHLDLYAYWLAKRGTHTMPARSDVDPAEIPELLPHVMIVERDGDQFRYRLIGTAINRSLGYDATGDAVGSHFAPPEAPAEARAIFQRVYKEMCPIFATGEFISKADLNLNMSMLTLPLSEDGEVVNMSISTFVTCFSATAAPQRGWLEGLPVKVDVVIDIKDAAELEKFCREWEQHCILADERPGNHDD